MDDRGFLHNVRNAAEALDKGLIPVKRDLTVKEQADMQIRLYSPCGCGSGQKLKFCCYKKSPAPTPGDV